MKRGRKMQDFCAGKRGVIHRMDDSTRLWKLYTRKDGTLSRVRNGCRACNTIGSKERSCMTDVTDRAYR